MNKATSNAHIERVKQATGYSECSDAVVLQVRERWAMPFATALTIGAGFLTKFVFDTNTLVTSLIVGAVGAVSTSLLQHSRLLARCGDSVVMLRLSHPLRGPEAVEHEWSPPVQASIDSGRLIKRVTVEGTGYAMVRSFAERFTAVTGAA